MGVITASTLTYGTGSGTGATTASVSPAVKSLVLVAVMQRKGSTPTPQTPAVSGASMTWTQVATLNPFADFRITVFRGLSATPGSGALTISNCDSGTNDIGWIVAQLKNVVTTGTNGADAVVQSDTQSSTGVSTGLTSTLSAFQKPSNAAIGFIAGQNLAGLSAFSAGSGFTQLTAVGSIGIIHGEFRDTQDTTVNWTWSSTDVPVVAISLEIKSSLRGGAILYNLT